MRRSYADARIDVSDCSTTPQFVVRSSCVHARRLLSYDMADGAPVSSSCARASRSPFRWSGRCPGVQLQLCSRMTCPFLLVLSAATSAQLQLCSRTRCPSCSSCRCRRVSSSCARAWPAPFCSCCRLRHRLSSSCVRASRSPFRWSGRVRGVQLQLCSRMACPFLLVLPAATSAQLQLCSRTAVSLPLVRTGPRPSAPVVFAHGVPLSAGRGVARVVQLQLCSRTTDPLRYVSGVCAGASAVACRRQPSGAVRGARGACPFSRRRHDRPPTSRASWPVHAARCVAGRAGAPPSPAGGTPSA